MWISVSIMRLIMLLAVRIILLWEFVRRTVDYMLFTPTPDNYTELIHTLFQTYNMSLFIDDACCSVS